MVSDYDSDTGIHMLSPNQKIQSEFDAPFLGFEFVFRIYTYIYISSCAFVHGYAIGMSNN